ncbi:MAG: tRNA uridine-5-carboxymethylaminomethyl(34) synthesis GTPase MnmE [Candidatus Saccharicenans sp.]
MSYYLDDTIIAVSTPPGPGGIGIVRLSGTEALNTATRIFIPAHESPALNPRKMCFGHLVDLETGEKLDSGYICYFPAPNSYTREDVVEISLHGSPVILNEAVRLGVRAGARPALPGEFTMRAYLHGRLDIIQAEAINDLIRASSLDQAKISFRQVEGSLSKKLSLLREQLIDILVLLETRIEFPEEEISVTDQQIRSTIQEVLKTLENLAGSYQRGRALLEGLTIALVGKTNVGKSTLFNTLLEEERAIVTPYPGTTRDFIRETIMVNGVLMKIIDMAGFGQAQHPVEEEGILRGQKLANRADGILVLLDASREETEEDMYILEKYRNKKRIIVFNKCDLPQKINKEKILGLNLDVPAVELSALTGQNVEKLRDLMVRTFSPSIDKNEEIILHEHQKTLVEQMVVHLREASRLLLEGFSEELVAEELRSAVGLFAQIKGEIKPQEVLEQIFGRFCIGK